MMPDVHAIVLAGGSGTRFWPASRRATPKQFLPVIPGSEETLIGATVRRISPLVPGSNVLVATGEHLIQGARRALPELPAAQFLGEPMARNTAPCIGWATAWIARTNPEALVMVLPSDHHIGDEAAFLAALERALHSASSSAITTIGVRPTRAETGYGYIELGETVGPELHRVTRFVEKPNREKAEQYLSGGRHLWNSGMFFFRASAMLGAIERHLPALAEGLARIYRASQLGVAEEKRETRAVFEALPPVSIDYGVMEKEAVLNVVTGDFGWNDLGSWESAWEVGDKDPSGNSSTGAQILIDARGNLIRDLRTDGQHRVIALIGVEDLCVIETDDALLIVPRERSQEARLAVELLNQRGDAKLT